MPIFKKLKGILGGSSYGVGSKRDTVDFSTIKQTDPAQFWDIVGELGDGAFGKVYKAEHKMQKINAALKRVDIVEETDLEDYSVEIAILSQCKHKNIVGLYEAFLFSGKLWMYLEYCAGGALDGIMADLERPLMEQEIKYVCREMCEALDFLHMSSVIHRDLKAGNVLLTQTADIKLADFGVSAKNNSIRQKRDSFIGTPYWMAPEVILCETIKDTPYDYKADIWSFGITLIELAQKAPPYSDMHPMRVLMKIQKSDPPTLIRPSKWSTELKDFIAKCLVRNVDQRPAASELLQHAFIRQTPVKKPILDLLNELNAEVIVETKDVDEDDVSSISTSEQSDSDSLSASTSSNSLQRQISKDSSTASDKTTSPAVVLTSAAASASASTPAVAKSPEVIRVTTASIVEPAQTVPVTTGPTTTAPGHKVPETTLPKQTVPTQRVPATAGPVTTVPASKVPATAVPAHNVPATTVSTTTVPKKKKVPTATLR